MARTRSARCAPASARRTLALGAALLLALVSAAAGAANRAGEVTHLTGALLATSPDGRSRVLAPRSEVDEGDVLTTAENTYARLKFSDGGVVTLRPNTRLQIQTYRFDERAPEHDSLIMSLIKGGLRSITGLLGKRRPKAYRMNTPVATIGIRGTHYGALFCQGDCAGLGVGGATPTNGLHVDVAEGAITLTNPAGQTVLTQGSFGYVPNLQSAPVQVPPSQGFTVSVPPPSAKPGPLNPSGSSSSPLSEDCTIQ